MNYKTFRDTEQNKRSSRSDFWVIFLMILLIFILGYYYRSDVITIWRSFLDRAQPCQQPLTYSISNIDPKFGMTEKRVLDEIAKAENIWESPIDKNLFEYSPTGRLKINLIYDYRQEATNTLKKLGITIRDDKTTYNTLETKYTMLKNQYYKEKAYLETLIKNYDASKNIYEKDIAYWNSQGGAPQKEYDALEQRRIVLNAQVTIINQTQNSLNGVVNTINASVVMLNKLVNNLNLQVDKYNGIGGSTRKEFNEGEYIRDANGTTINIFEFNDENQLIRVLAHEMGHALGLEHLDNPKALMYRLNEGKDSELTADDIAALKQQCRIK